MIAALVTIVLSAAALAVASAMVWDPVPAVVAAPLRAGKDALRVKPKCAACGFVQSVRRVSAAGNLPESYEITVRLRDGSTHVYTEASPASRQRGEHIVFIAGQVQPGE